MRGKEEKRKIGGIMTKERERERARYHTTWPGVPARARDKASRYLALEGIQGWFGAIARTE